MVKNIFCILLILISSFTVTNYNDEEKCRFQNVFNNISLNACLNGIVVRENNEIEAKFNKEIINNYFHSKWPIICNDVPSKISIVTFDKINGNINHKYGSSVQIKVVIKGKFKEFYYSTQYSVNIKGVIYENK